MAVLAVVAGFAASVGGAGPASKRAGGRALADERERFVPAGQAIRLVDTRPGHTTVDGVGAGIGELDAGSVLEVPVTGRDGLPASVGTAVLNLTVAGAAEPGFLAAYACDVERPLASSLNYLSGTTRAGMVIVDVDGEGTACVYNSGRTHLVVDVVGTFEAGDLTAGPPVRLIDTRDDGTTVDGAQVGGGPVAAGSVVRVPATDRGNVTSVGGAVALTVTVVHPATPGFAAAYTCGSEATPSSTVNFRPGDVIANVALVRPDGNGDVCVLLSAQAHLVVDAIGQIGASVVDVADRPRRVLDTRPGEAVVTGAPALAGARAGGSSTPVPVAGVGGVPSDVSAVLLNVTAVTPASPGFIALHPAGQSQPDTSTLNFGPGDVIANAALVPLGGDGRFCLFTSSPTHVVVDVVGWVPGLPTGEGGDCPDASPFPARRVVALYGNDTAAALGVLGEQPPAAAADRVAEVAAPYSAGDRPVQGAFELIATIATSFPGSSGLYRSVSSDGHVQRYLDVAEERGLLLILDIQPGRGDFLTEVRRYERFLREPIVHVALDPEWNVGPGQVPGEVVGQVDATEVNQVADYLAGIVAEEGIPDKILVVHQFQDRMLTRRSLLREPDGVVITIHMDGFGTQSQKLSTYSIVHADPPFSNGFKLFYDEDIDIFEPHEVLGLDPVPDLITYQ